jgi:Holliday junction resolvase RusA-like endonuclease
VVRLIKIIVFGDPVPKARARTVRLKNGQSVSYTPEKTASWEDSIRMQALAHRPEKLLDGPLVLEATFYRIKPQSKPKKCLYPDTKPDLDNLCKSVTDALEGLIYTNDSRLVDKILQKRFGDPPRVEIRIREAEGG